MTSTILRVLLTSYGGQVSVKYRTMQTTTTHSTTRSIRARDGIAMLCLYADRCVDGRATMF